MNQPDELLLLLRSGAPSAKSVIGGLWSALRDKLDPELQGQIPGGLGTVQGERLRIKTAYVAEDADTACLALDVLDMASAQAWELAVCPLPDGRVLAHRRSVWRGMDSVAGDPGLQAVWDSAIAPHLSDEAPALRHSPSFMGVAAAIASQGDIVVTRDDSARVAALQADLDYWRGLAREQGRQRAAAKSEPSYQVGQRDPAVPAATMAPVRQWKLKDIGEWAAENSHRIVILPRAVAEAKRAVYEDADLLYASLELLAEEYTGVKCSALDRNAFKDKADQLGLAYGGSVDPSVAGEKGDSYFVRWNGRKRFLDQHLCKGTSRDPRFTLRVYFTWDESIGKVVVGWLPTHLGIGWK